MNNDPAITAALLKIKTASEKHYMGVDVGGTNTRVAISSSDGEYVIVSKFLSRTRPTLISELERITASIASIMGKPVSGVCMAIAGPVTDLGKSAEITNYEGTADERMIRVSDLPFFPALATRFLNDLESCCYGVLALDSQSMLGEYFSPLWSTGDDSVKLKQNIHYAVMAAGTGFGCGLLIKLGAQFQVYPIEWGHVTIPPLGKDHPDRELDSRLIDFLSEKLYGGRFAPEFEDIVSGRGLTYVYDFLVQGMSDQPSGLSPVEIILSAQSNNASLAARAVALHYRLLMRAAQNAAVGLQVKGILLAGDNQVNNDPLVRVITKELQTEFLNHPKRHWVENVPVFAQNKIFNINLFGTLFVSRTLA